MAKFNELTEADRVSFIKDEFVRALEELLIEPAELKKVIAEDKFKTVMEFLPSIKQPDCQCGTCLDMDKLDTRIPPELHPVIEAARKRCEEKTY